MQLWLNAEQIKLKRLIRSLWIRVIRYDEEFDEHNDEIVKQYTMKEGGPIPILEMTYINKTQPKPCDKEVRWSFIGQMPTVASQGRAEV